MVHSVSGCIRGVQVKLWDPLRTRAILEHLRGVVTTRHYTNPRLPLPYLTFGDFRLLQVSPVDGRWNGCVWCVCVCYCTQLRVSVSTLQCIPTPWRMARTSQRRETSRMSRRRRTVDQVPLQVIIRVRIALSRWKWRPCFTLTVLHSFSTTRSLHHELYRPVN